MSEDTRCCGSGTCIIDTEGRCWCGQQWDGRKMCHAPPASAPAAVRDIAAEPTFSPAGGVRDLHGLPPSATWGDVTCSHQKAP